MLKFCPLEQPFIQENLPFNLQYLKGDQALTWIKILVTSELLQIFIQLQDNQSSLKFQITLTQIQSEKKKMMIQEQKTGSQACSKLWLRRISILILRYVSGH